MFLAWDLSKQPEVEEEHLLHRLLLLLHPRTLGNDELMAALVDHTGTHCRDTHTHTHVYTVL